MIAKFVRLQLKSFLRSSSFNFNLAIKIILGLGAAFYSVMILFLGVAAVFAFQEKGLPPVQTICNFLIFWWLFDLVFRFFLQKPPVMWVRPFLSQPIKRNTITRYLMLRSAVSFFNLYPAFFFLPFSITLLVSGYSVLGVIAWNIAIVSMTYFNNYLNLLINNKNGIFITVLVVLVSLAGLQFFGIINVISFTAPLFYSFYIDRWTCVIPLVLAIATYKYTFNYYRRSLYLDDAVKKKTKGGETTEYTWLNRFGLMGVFLKNDLRLMVRNKRARNTSAMSLFFIVYGLLILYSSYYNNIFWYVFAGIFVSGGFLFSFGGLVPSWDSAHYPLMMTQNIKYKEYISSKWWLMVIATFISMVLCTFYYFLNADMYWAILAGGIFNIGVNSHITLWSGAYVKTPIDLESAKKPFGDKQGFNAKTLLLISPKLLLPLLIFFLFYYAFNSSEIGFVAIAAAGLLGLLFRNKVFSIIEKTYKKEKYDTLLAYKEKP